jgi:hypothetical protein
MEAIPHLELMPRVEKDIEDCLDFVQRQPWGRPNDRGEDIYRGIQEVWRRPGRAPVRALVPLTRLELRRYGSAQFVIVYAYQPPNREFPLGFVSIRAVRHRRVGNVFSGVKEPDAVPVLSRMLVPTGPPERQSLTGRST